MISKNIAIKHARKRNSSFRSALSNLLAYIDKGDAKTIVSEVWHLNILSSGTGDAEMLALVNANPNAVLPIRHLMASWPSGEIPTTRQVKEASEMMLAEIGLVGCLAKCATHLDTDHIHLHVAVVTVDPDTFGMRKTAFIHEALQRFNAKLEHHQGWEPEEGARYKVNVHGKCVRIKKHEYAKSKTHADARTMTHMSGQRSATEIAKEVTGNIIGEKKIETWQQFHHALASSGLIYASKGSGAVVGVNQDENVVWVKSSAISADVSLKTLIKRFGEFEPPPNILVIANRHAEPVMSFSDRTRQLWQQFNRERCTRRAEKKRSWTALQDLHQKERKALDALQALAHDEIFNRDWSGHSLLLMAMRSVYASIVSRERDALRSRHALDQTEHRLQHKNMPDNDFLKWLERTNDLNSDADRHDDQPSDICAPGEMKIIYGEFSDSIRDIQNQCRRDAMIALHMHANGHNQREIKLALDECSPLAALMPEHVRYSERLSMYPLSERGLAKLPRLSIDRCPSRKIGYAK